MPTWLLNTLKHAGYKWKGFCGRCCIIIHNQPVPVMLLLSRPVHGLCYPLKQPGGNINSWSTARSDAEWPMHGKAILVTIAKSSPSIREWYFCNESSFMTEHALGMTITIGMPSKLGNMDMMNDHWIIGRYIFKHIMNIHICYNHCSITVTIKTNWVITRTIIDPS